MKKVRPSAAWRNAGIVTLLLGAAGFVCGVWFHRRFVAVCGCVLLAISLLCWAARFRISITFGQDFWTLRRWVFPSRRYTRTDIRAITFGTPLGGYTLHLTHGCVHISANAKNGAAFRAWVEKGYRQANQRPLPYEPPHIFHNNIKNPWAFLLISVGVGLLVLATAIAMTVALSAPREIPALTERRILVEAVAQKGDYVRLSTDTENFTVPLCVPAESLAAYTGSELLVKIDSSQSPALLWWAASADGQTLFTPQEVCEYLAHLDTRNRLFAWGIVLIYWLLFAGGCYVLNHATEHPRIAALLVKPEQRNF